MNEEKFMTLVKDNKGFEVVYAYRDDVDHFLGGKNDHYWYVISKNGKVKEAYTSFYNDGEWKDHYIKGDGIKRKITEAKSGTTIDMIVAKAYLAHEESWVKDKKGTLIEADHPYIHYVKGFGDKALDVSKEYGVNIGYNDLEDTPAGFHLRDLTVGDKVEIFE